MKIKEIANEINIQAKKYRIGEFQQLRKQIKGLSRKANSNIFTSETISDEGWAFHYGGRKEIQFNIGIENDKLRYGLAFSLETSRSLPDLSILYPKILKLNSIIRNNPNFFINYKMWYWRNKRSETKNVYEIDDKLAQQGTFIFIGKLMDINNLDYSEILNTFDELLDIYIEVETETKNLTQTNKRIKEKKLISFKFDNKGKQLPSKSKYNRLEKEINIDARHSYLQERLYNTLIELFGNENVGLENYINGNRIDIVLKLTGNKYIFYEVKTGSSAKSCIRQAMGQLFEYAFWNRTDLDAEIVVAGEFEMDITTLNYIKYLKSEFKIPISYHKIE